MLKNNICNYTCNKMEDNTSNKVKTTKCCECCGCRYETIIDYTTLYNKKLTICTSCYDYDNNTTYYESEFSSKGHLERWYK